MGVYINMEMPQNCGECLFKHLSPTGESLVCDISLSTVSWNERPFDCPLVHVPPHGRLGDLDALHKLFLEKAKEHKGAGGAMVAMAALCIATAPTIIPASEEGET